MPHISVKIVGKTEEDKVKLAASINQAVMDAVGADEATISISVEDIEADDWVENVYKPDILGHWDQLHKKPGYNPL